MRIPTADDIKRLVFQWMQPLESGNIDSIDEETGFSAKATNLSGYGNSDQLRHAYPYGIIGSPIKGTVAYILNLFGSLSAPIILTYLDKHRPKPSSAGEIILYCLTADGSSVPVKVTLMTDGKLVLAPEAKTLIGSVNATEPLVLGNVLVTLLGSSIDATNTLNGRVSSLETALLTFATGLTPVTVIAKGAALAASIPAMTASLAADQAANNALKTQYLNTAATNILAQKAFTERGSP